jgi:hypothetical protein
MNNNEYLLLMKQAIDNSVKKDDKIQDYLVWLHEKTQSLGSHYQESALRAFYCDVVEGGQSVNRQISQILDINLDKDISEVREIADQFTYLWDDDNNPVERGVYYIESREPAYSRFPEINFKRLVDRVNISPAVDIVIDRNFALVCKVQLGTKIYLRHATALLIRDNDKLFRKEIMSLMSVFNMLDYRKKSNVIKYEKYLVNWQNRLSSCLYSYRNLRLDWQFSDEQKQLLNDYCTANKFLLDCLQESNASPEVQKEIQDTLFLPIAKLERRKSSIPKILYYY